jgi:hypothetical protein
MKKSIAWIMIVSIFTSHCTFYRLRLGDPKEYNVGLDDKKINNSRIFLHVGETYCELRNWRKTDNKIVGTVTSVNEETDFYYKKGLSKKNFSASKKIEHNLLQMHLFVPEAIYNENGTEITIDINDIERVHLLDKNGALTVFSFVATTAVSATAAISLFLAIACSCPHVYMNDGNNWHFTNSMFTGAMNPTLERFDYKKIPDFHSDSTSLSLELRNEEKEIQYTNTLKLVAIYHQKGEEIIANQKGEFTRVTSKRFAQSLTNDDGDLKNNFSSINSESYNFSSTDKDGMSNLHATFSTENLKSANLILSVKNPKWGGFVYHEFTKLFGDYFQKWVKSNTRKSKKQLYTNIRKAGILLAVEIKEGGKWKQIEDINLVGEAGFQKIAVEIPQKYLKHKSLTFRLRSGFQFWEINALALSETVTENLKIEELDAKIVSKETDLQSLIQSDDSEYLVHRQGEKPIMVNFSGLKTDSERTLFLKSKGYYKTIQNHLGQPEWKQLISINKFGGFSRFSKQKFEEWSLWKDMLTEIGLTEKLIEVKN